VRKLCKRHMCRETSVLHALSYAPNTVGTNALFRYKTALAVSVDTARAALIVSTATARACSPRVSIFTPTVRAALAVAVDTVRAALNFYTQARAILDQKRAFVPIWRARLSTYFGDFFAHACLSKV